MANANIVQCPWCAEDILAEAKKCKHCGEFIAGSPGGATRPEAFEPVWRRAALGWRCIAHKKNKCQPCGLKSKCPASHLGKTGDVSPGPNATTKLSEVGRTASGELRCPNCGGMSFVARRKTSTKVLVGVLCLAGSAKHVDCVTCGARFKRA